MTGTFPAYGMSPSLSTITSTSSSITSSIPDTERECPTLSPGPIRQGQVRGTDEGPRGDLLERQRGWRGLGSFQLPHTAASLRVHLKLTKQYLFLNWYLSTQ